MKLRVFVAALLYGFETIAQQAHIFADLSQAAQVTLLDDQPKDMGQQANVSKLDDIVNIWVTGNEDKLANVLQTETQTALDQRLLTDRNEAWAKATCRNGQGGVRLVAKKSVFANSAVFDS